MNDNAKQLKTLSTFYYVCGGLGVFFALVPLMHLGLGIMMVHAPEKMSGANGAPPPEFIGYMFAGMGLLFFLIGQAAAWGMIYAGKCIAKTKNYAFVFAIACVACMFVPIGTALGVYSVITLSKEEVKALFD